MDCGLVLIALGLGVGLIGSVILAISLNKLNTELVLAILFVDTTLGSLLSQTQNIPRFEGIDERLRRGVESSRNRTFVGLVMIVFSFGFQLVGLIFQIYSQISQ